MPISAARILLAVVLVGLWQLAASQGWIDPFFFSKPGAIAERLNEWLHESRTWEHIFVTLAETALAFTLGSLLGLAGGFALARTDYLSRLLDPYLKIANALPRIALAPLFLLWFGIGIGSKVALGVTLVFFPVFFNAFRGVRDVSPVLVDNARMLGATEQHLWRDVYFPSALGAIFAGLETALGLALIGAVVGEYMNSARGLGYLISQAEHSLDATGLFAGMALLAAIVLLLAALVGRLERQLLRWKLPE